MQTNSIYVTLGAGTPEEIYMKITMPEKRMKIYSKLMREDKRPDSDEKTKENLLKSRETYKAMFPKEGSRVLQPVTTAPNRSEILL